MQVKSIAEWSLWSILQYFRPSLSYHLSLRSLFCLFLSRCLRRVLLYMFMCRFVISLSVQHSVYFLTMFLSTVKPVLSGHSKRRSNLRPSFSYHLSLRSLFCLFLSGHLRQVLLYIFICRFIISLSALIMSIFLLCFCLYVYL